MDIPQSTARPGGAERVARGAVLVFLLLASVTLAFGLGYGVSDLRKDDGGSSSGSTTRASSGTTDDAVGAVSINEIYEFLKENYVDKRNLDPNLLKDAAIGGMITALNDRETHYLTPDDIKSGALDMGSSYQGIGATVSDSSGQVTIVAPFRDSPAEKAGIRSGDIILEVDGKPTDGWTDSQAVEVIRGPKGTTVALTVKHTDGTTQTLQVVRGEIPIESVFTEPNLEIIPGESGKTLVDRTGKAATDIAYVNISQFHEQTLSELRAKMKDVESKGYKGLIVDVRANPVGLLTATRDVADEFLAKGIIISQVDSEGKQSSDSARAGGILTKIPIVVLQDAGSASGAEVLAAALRDNGRAKIVGTTSFGKGTVNRLFQLKDCGQSNCGAIYMSIARWLTPKGEQIEGVGISPDVEVKMTAEQYIDQGDIQLFKAIDILRGNP